ncbi:restriction endonuclease subunit S [Gallaecimonas xiamenensis]|uniref:Restriction modification system DNA specificity subunit n=1 Tax=Gallaecimonas xiamenensis 3-C-1 TaxID=745411 RepID=K2JQB0_9GAMM|nr:restriction endonuclease subunit S [Gallaecimonas xiamenensis]EKE67445.1 restriction modification system DNA specificity subunit [Gallaecimonas xiamenensis 3-C-1]
MIQAVHDLLEQHFDTAFAAPGGIAKLRELILTLAMQGKLVEQDPNDPPASELLKEIEAEKQRLISEKKIKKQKPLPPIKPEEVPYQLPQGWAWVRLDELGVSQTGTTPPSKNPENYGDHIPFIGPGSIKNGNIDYSGQGLSLDGLSKGRLIEKDSVLMVCIGGSIGKHAINQMDVTCNQQINTLTPFKPLSVKYTYFTMEADYFQRTVLNKAGGSATPIINKQKWSSIPIPLPPLPEQHRIVRRIDQLMVRCDELEKLRKDREEKRLQVHAAAISQLLNAPENSGWPFIQQHFGELYTVKENVAELRKAILQLAVMGRLVPQDPNDPPASELLKEIEVEKQRLIEEKKIKKQKPWQPINPEEVPYMLPQGWEWVRVEDVFNTTSGTTFDAALEKDAGSYAYVKVGDMNLQGNELFIETSSRYIDPDEKMLRSLISTGSVIFPKRGGAIATNKKRIITDPVFVDLNIMAITPIFGLLTEYAYLWLSTIDLALLNTGTSVPQINHKDIDPLLFPLPALEEQHRIVARIDQLMALCNNLDEQIEAATNKQKALLNAVMAQV